MTAPSSLIINSAFVEPQQHWVENTDRTLRREPTRRPAGYEIIDTRENTRLQVPIPLVDDIRQRVALWRTAGWPGVTAVTRELLGHWWDVGRVSGRQYPFYFCQLEAIETLSKSSSRSSANTCCFNWCGWWNSSWLRTRSTFRRCSTKTRCASGFCIRCTLT